MKNIKYFILAFFMISTFIACDDDRVSVDDGAAEGGLMTVLTSLIVHIQSSQDVYSAQVKTFQGPIKTTQVEVYKQFVSVDGSTSERVLHTSMDVMDQVNTVTHTLEFTFPDLKSGLTLNGAPLPADDNLVVGDKIVLTFAAKTSEGNTHFASGSTEISVSGRFAGTYVVTASDYWRIGVQSGVADWVGVNRIIKSIDAITYEHVGIGPWSYDGNDYYFSEDAFFFFNVTDDNRIEYYANSPDGNPVTGLGTYLITCATDITEFGNVPCDETTNLVIKDDVDGKDQLIFTMGYYTASGDANEGAREFYEVVEKL